MAETRRGSASGSWNRTSPVTLEDQARYSRICLTYVSYRLSVFICASWSHKRAPVDMSRWFSPWFARVYLLRNAGLYTCQRLSSRSVNYALSASWAISPRCLRRDTHAKVSCTPGPFLIFLLIHVHPHFVVGKSSPARHVSVISSGAVYFLRHVSRTRLRFGS